MSFTVHMDKRGYMALFVSERGYSVVATSMVQPLPEVWCTSGVFVIFIVIKWIYIWFCFF